MDSIREQILQAFALKTGASRSLRAVPLALFDNSPEPREDEPPAYDVVNSTIPARIEYVYQLAESELDTASTLMNNKIAEIIKSATETDRQLGGLALNTYETESGWEIREAGSRTVACYVVFAITYAYNRGDPFDNSNLP